MLRNTLAEIFTRELNLSPTEFSDELAYNAIPEWDLASHMSLVLAIEEKFDIALESDDIVQMTSVGKIIRILSEKGIAGDQPAGTDPSELRLASEFRCTKSGEGHMPRLLDRSDFQRLTGSPRYRNRAASRRHARSDRACPHHHSCGHERNGVDRLCHGTNKNHAGVQWRSGLVDRRNLCRSAIPARRPGAAACQRSCTKLPKPWSHADPASGVGK